MTPQEAFGKALREYRTKRKLSQEELASKSGYHRTYISLMERGMKSPSLNTIFEIAKALACTPSSLVERAEKLLQSTINK